MTTQTHEPGWRPTDTLAARLILMRRELALSQRQASERAGIPFGQWQGLEDGIRQPRGIDKKVARIALAFGVDRDWLMWGGLLGDGSGGPGITPDSDGATHRYSRVRSSGFRRISPVLVAA